MTFKKYIFISISSMYRILLYL